MTEVLERGSSFVRDLGDAARENPVSAALIGMGVLWLFGGGAVAIARSTDRTPDDDWMSDRAGGLSRARGAAMDSGAKLGANVMSAAERLKANASAAVGNASRLGREQASAVSQYARSIPDSGAEMVSSFRSSLADLFEAQPLALGAIGLAIGAGIAAAVPITKTESEYLGEASDAFKEAAKQFADEQSTRAAEVADRALNAAADEAQRQGLTVDAAKSAADEVSKKVGRVADAAGKGVSERMNPNS
jgi:uncharacterized phage infection (PIP) family protein YhgE